MDSTALGQESDNWTFDVGDAIRGDTVDQTSLQGMDDGWKFTYTISEADITSSTTADTFDETLTRFKNGGTYMTSLSQFVRILATNAVDGPRHFRSPNLRDIFVQVGRGTQYTAFKVKSDWLSHKDIVIKRVNTIKRDVNGGKDFALDKDYRQRMRLLELEVLALCQPQIRNHRNIVSLLEWGFDYEDRRTPIPVLIMEEAMMDLSRFLTIENEGLLGNRKWDIRQHIALDIAAGLAIMHKFNIVHGDVKPENVLIFKQDNAKVPFVAKLSDFGACIDMQPSDDGITEQTYRGTLAWIGPEVIAYDNEKYGTFSPSLLLKFDAYSYGLMLLAIFITHGEPPELATNRKEEGNDAKAAVRLLQEQSELPSAIRTCLKRALPALLAERPAERILPCPEILKTETLCYKQWYRSLASSLKIMELVVCL